jgi:4,5-dihydroxyphthalate decarboxylase
MSRPLSISYGGEVYDRTFPLFAGAVPTPGLALRYFHLGIEDLFHRQSQNGEFDVAEYSLGAHLGSLESPDYDFVGLPIFPLKTFRHSAIYVHRDSGIQTPADLHGRLVGTPEWSMTASLWARGILAEHYGVDLTRLGWRTGGLDTPGRKEKSKLVHAARYDIAPLGADDTLGAAFLEGRLDALITARPPAAFAGRPEVRRLFEDYPAEERAFFKATSIFPIMHIVVARRQLVEANPWLPSSLRNAFDLARQTALSRLRTTGFNVATLAWAGNYAQDEAALMGDAFANGIEENRAALEAVCRYALDQGFLSRAHRPEQLFAGGSGGALRT